MKNWNWKAWLLIIGYPTTTLVSFLGYSSQCRTLMEYMIIFSSTVILQAGAFIFVEMYMNHKKNKARNLILAIVCVGISIMFSINMNLAFYTRNNNEVVQNSAEYKVQQKIASEIDNISSSISGEINSLKSERDDILQGIDNNEIASLNTEKSMWESKGRKNYYGQIARVDKLIANAEQKKANIKQEYSQKISELNSSYRNTKAGNIDIGRVDTTSDMIESDKGLNPTINFFSKITGASIYTIGLIIFTVLTVASEITLVVIHAEVAKDWAALPISELPKKPKPIELTKKVDSKVRNFPKIKNMNPQLKAKLVGVVGKK